MMGNLEPSFLQAAATPARTDGFLGVSTSAVPCPRGRHWLTEGHRPPRRGL